MQGARVLILTLTCLFFTIGCMEVPGETPFLGSDGSLEASTFNDNQGQPSISELGQADTEESHTDGEEEPIHDDQVLPPNSLVDEESSEDPECGEITDSSEDQEGDVIEINLKAPCL